MVAYNYKPTGQKEREQQSSGKKIMRLEQGSVTKNITHRISNYRNKWQDNERIVLNYGSRGKNVSEDQCKDRSTKVDFNGERTGH